MGHIANKIDAKDKKLAEVLNGQRYKIDVFQREYRWQRPQIEALISDLASSFAKSYHEGDTIDDYNSYDCYYMGPIVLCVDEKGDLSIIDGQQRLTSLTLLLIYLNHLQKRLDLIDDLTKEIESYLYVKKGGKKTLVINVETRNEVINKLITGIDISTDNIDMQSESIQNILDRYNDIATLFPTELNDVQRLPLFIEWLLEKVVLVEVRAYSMDNAYSIFETMNDRGLSLNPTEILKGYLLSKIVENSSENEEKAEEANKFWTERINKMRTITSTENVDMDFFRAWLRAKYADTQRSRKTGSENEDFELIGTQFHSWFKNNTSKIQLTKALDYYFFIKSDFDFYSSLYLRIYKNKYTYNTICPELYLNSIYSIADSLSYPLFLSSITKIDDESIIDSKISIIARFIDRYANIRTLQNKNITQSSIRIGIYELVKQIRNTNESSLANILDSEIQKLLSSSNLGIYIPMRTMNNNGYFHYLFARIKYHMEDKNELTRFSDLLRSRKHSSFILYPIFKIDDLNTTDEQLSASYVNSAANFCLINRDKIDEYNAISNISDKISFLYKNQYIPEMRDVPQNINPVDFISVRDNNIASILNQIWG
jgi:hypothetical protein